MSLRPPRTLTRLLTLRLIAVAIFAAIAQVAIVLVYYEIRNDKTGILIAVHEAGIIAAHTHLAADGTLAVAVDPASVQHYVDYPSDYGVEVIDSTGRVVYALNAALLGDLRLDLEGHPDLWTTSAMRAGERIRVTAKHYDTQSTPFWVAFAMRHDPADLYAGQMLDEMVDHVVEPMLPLFVLMLLASAFVIRRSLQPLTRAAEAAARLDPRGHRMLLPTDALPKEVADLVGAINTSLEHLQDVFEDQRQFLATAAHELRTPLAVLMLQLDRLSGPALPTLRADVEHMTRLVNQMLLVARLDALPSPQWSTVDLASVAKAVVSRLAPLAAAQHRDLEVNDEGNAACRADRDMIADALRNLIENAIRHAPEDSTICVTAGPGPRLAVDDAGPGIAPGDRARLHQRFWHSPKRNESGAGLGLFIVGKVVAQHGGTVSISQSPLGGARVEIVLPAAVASAGATAPDRRAAESAEGASVPPLPVPAPLP
jgi:signal transduction histidine kinase